LAFVLALAETLEDREAGLFGVGDGEGVEFLRGAEGGNDFADGLFAGRAMGEGLGREGAVQREAAAADLALAFTQLVFVDGHVELRFAIFDLRLLDVRWDWLRQTKRPFKLKVTRLAGVCNVLSMPSHFNFEFHKGLW